MQMQTQTITYEQPSQECCLDLKLLDSTVDRMHNALDESCWVAQQTGSSGPSARPWDALPSLFMEALSRLLASEDLKAARLVCLTWASDLVAGIDNVTLWPGRLRRMPQASSSSRCRLRCSTLQRSLHKYCPQRLLSGASSTTQMHIVISDMCTPTSAQMKQMAEMLTASASRALDMDIVVESCMPDSKKPSSLASLAKPLLSMLQTCSEQRQQHITSIKLGTGLSQIPSRYIMPALAACRHLRKFILQQPASDFSPSHLQQLADINSLQQLCLPLDKDSFSSLFTGGMQQVLDALAGLTQLTDLALSFHDDINTHRTSTSSTAGSSTNPASSSSGGGSDSSTSSDSISIPDWPKMTALQQLNKEPSNSNISPALKFLGPRMASNLQALDLANFQLPSSCTTLASLTSLSLLHGQDITNLPGTPQLHKLQVHLSMTFLRLLDVIRKAPKLQALELLTLLEPVTSSHPGCLMNLSSCLEDLIQLLRALPAAAPGLNSLTTPTSWPAVVPSELPEDEDEWYSFFGWRLEAIVDAASKLTKLQHLAMTAPHECPVFFTIEPLRSLTNLQSLQGSFFIVDIAALPASLTSLVAERVSSCSNAALMLMAEQDRPKHTYPQLKHLHLQLRSSEVFYADRMCALSLLEPALQQAEHISLQTHSWVMNPASIPADSSTPPEILAAAAVTEEQEYNCSVLSRCVKLRSLTLQAPWQGMQQHLAPLTALTSLSFSSSSDGSDDDGTTSSRRSARAAQQAARLTEELRCTAQHMTQLRRLHVACDTGRQAACLAKKLKQLLPGCRLSLSKCT